MCGGGGDRESERAGSHSPSRASGACLARISLCLSVCLSLCLSLSLFLSVSLSLSLSLSLVHTHSRRRLRKRQRHVLAKRTYFGALGKFGTLDHVPWSTTTMQSPAWSRSCFCSHACSLSLTHSIDQSIDQSIDFSPLPSPSFCTLADYKFRPYKSYEVQPVVNFHNVARMSRLGG